MTYKEFCVLVEDVASSAAGQVHEGKPILMSFEGTTYDIHDISYDHDLRAFIIEEV